MCLNEQQIEIKYVGMICMSLYYIYVLTYLCLYFDPLIWQGFFQNNLGEHIIILLSKNK